VPKKYEKIRDACAKGAKVDSPKYDKCQAIAAAIYNKQRGPNQRPVTGRKAGRGK
jgi:hypothetical protein